MKRTFSPLFILIIMLYTGLAAQEIHMAAQEGDLVKVKMILAKNPESIHIKDQNGWTPLHAACFGGHLDIVKFLISEGADINALSDAMNTTLHWAIHSYSDPQNKKEIIEFLISLNPELAARRNDKGISPLMWVGNDLEETISLLLKNGADINAKDKNGYTALHNWIRWWQNDKSKFLIENGAEINRGDNHGRTALHLAAIVGRMDKTEFLMNQGADINITDYSGFTPLDYAKKFAHAGLADFIRKSGGRSNKPKESIKYNNLINKDLKNREAAIWYLDSNGWAVKTKNHLLIFDFLNWGIMPPNPCLSNGRTNLEEIQGMNTTVFVSNPSGFSQDILEWKKNVKNISYVFGYSPEKLTDVYVVGPHEKKLVNGLEIIPIQSVGGGAGFLVKVDGLSIFHGGLHCLWKNDLKDKFLQELEFVAKNTEHIDIAFLPISATRAVKESALEGFLYFGEKLRPNVILPSGGSGTHKFLYQLAADKIKSKGLRIGVKCVDNRGDRFFYRHGKIM